MAVFKLPVSSPLVELAQQVPVQPQGPSPAASLQPPPEMAQLERGRRALDAQLFPPYQRGVAAPGDGVGRAFDEFAAATPAAAGGVPRSLSDLPQINRDDYREKSRTAIAEERDKSGAWYERHGPLPGMREFAAGVADFFDQPGFTEEAANRYLNDRLSRYVQIADLAGVPSDVRAATIQELRYRIENNREANSPEKMMEFAEELIVAEEANLVPAASRAGSGAVATEELSPAGFSPQDIAVLQATIGQFMQPYTDQMAESGAAQAALMNSYADSAVTPGIAALARQQASSVQAGGDRLAAAYMAQAQAFPTIRAYDEVAQLRQQIAGMQAQMAQQQFAGGGVGDFEATLQGLGAGG
jgi:hypothetical protein